MLNVHQSYKPPISLRILFQYGGYPSKSSCMKIFRDLVVPGGGCCKGIIIQLIMTPTGVLPNGQLCLRIKGDVTGASIHAPIHSNSMYVQKIRPSIYNTRLPEHPHSPIRWYKHRPQGHASRPRYTYQYYSFPASTPSSLLYFCK